MYTVAVRRNFIAQHYLIGGNWGPENEKHSHHYQLELQLDGTRLDEYNYLVDIVAIEAALDRLVETYRDRMLNDLPEFQGVNPSIELFSRYLCAALDREILAPNIQRVTVRLWENETAWAAYQVER
ncbi:MAG TPA: 6-carboxytetrahydropterin synthase [Anaerolineaceae bacterium]|nr:6-carboxytetrahydropterin synthase [Anaerolineaceae bacterium]